MLHLQIVISKTNNTFEDSAYRSFISKTNNTFEDRAKDLDIVITILLYASDRIW